MQIEANAPANQWIHLTGTFDDPSNTIRLYVNGVLVAQQITAGVPMTNMTGPNPGVGIGNIHVAPFSVPFNGLIDEVELFAARCPRPRFKASISRARRVNASPTRTAMACSTRSTLAPPRPSARPSTPRAVFPASASRRRPAWLRGIRATAPPTTFWAGTIRPRTNAVSFVPGIVGQGFDFGPGGYIDIPNSAALNNQQFTVDAWARPDGPGPNNDGAGSVILQKNINTLSGIQTSLQLVWRGTDNRFLFNAYNVQVATASTFQTGQFYHVAGTYDGTRPGFTSTASYRAR